MIEEDGKEGEAEEGQPGKKRDPWQGSKKESSASVSVSIFIPTLLGSSLVSVTFLSVSVHGLSGSLNALHPALTPAVLVPSPPPFIGSWLAPGSSGHSSFWPLEV